MCLMMLVEVHKSMLFCFLYSFIYGYASLLFGHSGYQNFNASIQVSTLLPRMENNFTTVTYKGMKTKIALVLVIKLPLVLSSICCTLLENKP